MEKGVLHFLQQNDWLLYPLCTLFGLSWGQDSLESKAPGYFWHCFGLRWLSVKWCFTELLVGLGLIKKPVAWVCSRICTIAITALFPLHNSPIAVLTCKGSYFGSCLHGLDKEVTSKGCVFFCCPPPMLGSHNLLLPGRSRAVALFLGLRKPQNITILLLICFNSGFCYLDFSFPILPYILPCLPSNWILKSTDSKIFGLFFS